MNEALSLIVEQLVKENLSPQERESLTAEISKNVGLSHSLRDSLLADLSNIELSSGKSQPFTML